MRLNEFRVQKYKTITDTGWVKVRPDVTCLLGKNESGKSAVMQAIWKFKNARGTGYDFLYDYPKERYSKDRGTDPIVTSLRFVLEASDREGLIAAGLPAPEVVEVSTTYAGAKTYSFELTPTPVAIPPLMLDLQKVLKDPGPDEAVEAVLVQARAEVRPLSEGSQDASAVRDAARKLKLLLPQVATVLGDRQAEFVAAIDSLASIRLELMLPHMRAVAVAATCIGGDEELARVGVALLSDLVPPGLDRRHREHGCVVVDTDAAVFGR
jgi:hypothetical protein